MHQYFSAYLRLNRSAYILFAGEALVNLITGSFLLIFNIYLRKIGYTDSDVGGFTSMRYFAVFVLAFPIGVWLRGKPARALMMASSVFVPISSLLLLWQVETGGGFWAWVLMFLWGAGLAGVQSSAIPYIFRTVEKGLRAEAMALHYASMPFCLVLSGVIIWLMGSIGLDEATVLRFFSGLGFLALPVLYYLRRDEPDFTALTMKISALRNEYDWGLIAAGVFPTLLLAVGAGLSIPFMNLFFYNVFHLDYDTFSLLGAFANLLAIVGIIGVPQVSKRYGYRVSILLSQSLSVGFLLLLALTDVYSMLFFAFAAAVMSYLMRQPLMNLARPMATELVIHYVGARNREVATALKSGIWNGSLFFSGLIFKWLRGADYSFAVIFTFTAILYAAGVAAYWLLILAEERRKAA